MVGMGETSTTKLYVIEEVLTEQSFSAIQDIIICARNLFWIIIKLNRWTEHLTFLLFLSDRRSHFEGGSKKMYAER